MMQGCRWAWPKPQPARSEEGHGCWCRQTLLVNCDPLLEDKNILSSTSFFIFPSLFLFLPVILFPLSHPSTFSHSTFHLLFPSSLILSLSICWSIHPPFLKSHLGSVSLSHWGFPVICKCFFDLPHLALFSPSLNRPLSSICVFNSSSDDY